MAKEYFDHWFESAGRYLDTGISHTEKAWNKEAASELHQATERYYICFLLVTTLYFPRSHNIKFLRSLAEDKEPRLIEAWPRATRQDRSMPGDVAQAIPGLGTLIVDALARQLKARVSINSAKPGTSISIVHDNIAAIDIAEGAMGQRAI